MKNVQIYALKREDGEIFSIGDDVFQIKEDRPWQTHNHKILGFVIKNIYGTTENEYIVQLRNAFSNLNFEMNVNDITKDSSKVLWHPMTYGYRYYGQTHAITDDYLNNPLKSSISD